MKNRLSLLCFSMLFVFAASVPAFGLSVLETQYYNGHTYYLLEQANWTDSQTAAALLGGNLVTINDYSEQMWIYNTFTNSASIDRHLWIGLYDPDAASNSSDRYIRRTEFQWISGETTTYTNWSPFEPNNEFSTDPATPELYVHIWVPADVFAGRWNNYVNLQSLGSYPIHGVVEVAPVPEPATLLLLGSGLVGLAGLRRKFKTS